MSPLKKSFSDKLRGIDKAFAIEDDFKDEKEKEKKETEALLNIPEDERIDESDLIISRGKGGVRDLHNHNGVSSERISITNLIGFIETVTVAPTSTPRHFYEQFKIYYDDTASPSTRRLYIYSNKAQEWSYVALTV
jgi:hypothetical protein